MKYFNPYTHACNKFRNSASNEWSENAKPLIEYRGVFVFEKTHRCFDYVKDGICIAQRAGFNKEGGKQIIDDFLDRTTNYTNTTYHAFERMWQAYHDGLQLIGKKELNNILTNESRHKASN